MRNFNFKIPDPLDRRLKAESDRTGASLSEIVRRAIDEHLERREGPTSHGWSNAPIEEASQPALARG